MDTRISSVLAQAPNDRDLELAIAASLGATIKPVGNAGASRDRRRQSEVRSRGSRRCLHGLHLDGPHRRSVMTRAPAASRHVIHLPLQPAGRQRCPSACHAVICPLRALSFDLSATPPCHSEERAVYPIGRGSPHPHQQTAAWAGGAYLVHNGCDATKTVDQCELQTTQRSSRSGAGWWVLRTHATFITQIELDAAIAASLAESSAVDRCHRGSVDQVRPGFGWSAVSDGSRFCLFVPSLGLSLALVAALLHRRDPTRSLQAELAAAIAASLASQAAAPPVPRSPAAAPPAATDRAVGHIGPGPACGGRGPAPRPHLPGVAPPRPGAASWRDGVLDPLPFFLRSSARAARTPIDPEERALRRFI
jgi:hypothetical protein